MFKDLLTKRFTSAVDTFATSTSRRSINFIGPLIVRMAPAAYSIMVFLFVGSLTVSTCYAYLGKYPELSYSPQENKVVKSMLICISVLVALSSLIRVSGNTYGIRAIKVACPIITAMLEFYKVSMSPATMHIFAFLLVGASVWFLIVRSKIGFSYVEDLSILVMEWTSDQIRSVESIVVDRDEIDEGFLVVNPSEKAKLLNDEVVVSDEDHIPDLATYDNDGFYIVEKEVLEFGVFEDDDGFQIIQ